MLRHQHLRGWCLHIFEVPDTSASLGPGVLEVFDPERGRLDELRRRPAGLVGDREATNVPGMQDLEEELGDLTQHWRDIDGHHFHLPGPAP